MMPDLELTGQSGRAIKALIQGELYPELSIFTFSGYNKYNLPC